MRLMEGEELESADFILEVYANFQDVLRHREQNMEEDKRRLIASLLTIAFFMLE